MKSPFPGMDPFVERRWREFHNRMIILFGDRLNESLPADLEAHVEENVFVDCESTPRTIYPDVAVLEKPSLAVKDVSVGAIAVTEPSLVMFASEAPPQRHLEIVDLTSGGRVVTIIEMISPANKVGEGRVQYLRKRREYLAAGVNLVEVDLLRHGESVVMGAENLPAEKRTPFIISIRRGVRTEVYCVGLRESLPNLAIPLRPTDVDIILQIQPTFDEAYRRARLGSLNYHEPLDPPLSPDDAAWAAELIRQARPPR